MRENQVLVQVSDCNQAHALQFVYSYLAAREQRETNSEQIVDTAPINHDKEKAFFAEFINVTFAEYCCIQSRT